MSNFINSFLHFGFNIGQLWLSLLPLVPLIVLIFSLSFGVSMIRNIISSRRSSMISQFLAEGGLYTDDERIKRWADDL